MHYVYIIHSKTLGRYYVGESVNPHNRVLEHNSGKYHKSSTKAAIDWEVKVVFSCENRLNALRVEEYIKSMKSSKFLLRLIENNQFREGFKRLIYEKLNITIQ